MLRVRHLLPVVVIASAVAAAPAAAAPAEHWKSETNNGDEAYYSTKGKKLFNMSGYIPTTCVPSSGYPRSGSTEFTPPGAFKVGKTRKATDTRYVPWWGDTDFHYRVTVKQRRKGAWLVDRHVNYSYVEYRAMGGGVVDQTTWVCQGDDKFVHAPPR